MEREDRDRHDVKNWRRSRYEADYGHPEGPVPNLDHQPRSLVMGPTEDDGAAQVGDNVDDMAISSFPVLAPHLRSVAYPDDFKPNLHKYDSRSDPNIYLSTYYVTVKAVGDNYEHMSAYFPLVMGDAPSLWLNNLPTGSITSSADLS
jgi:hypothetical protein